MRALLCINFAMWMLISAHAQMDAILTDRVPSDYPVTSYIYIWQEHLAVTVSESNAVVKGTFQFRYNGAPQTFAKMVGVNFFVPVWFPEQNANDSRVAGFWAAFKRDEINHITAANSSVFEDAVGLRVSIGESPQAIYQFGVLTTNVWKGWHTNKWRVFQEVQQPGFSCLVFEFLRARDLLQKQLPVTITYRQPLLQSPGGGVLFYCPVFDHLPARVSTLNTNDYLIMIKAAAGCSLNGIMGTNSFTLNSGQSTTLSPQHHTPILIVSAKEG